MIKYEIFGQELIGENAIEQMDKVMSIEPAIAGALMPDAHLGYGMPIGGVVLLDNAISPNFVGFDIACRMKLTLFNDITADDIEDDEWLAAMRKSTQLGVGANWPLGQRKTHEILFRPEIDDLDYDRDLIWRQLGTSGGGNHFLDIVEGEIYALRDTPIAQYREFADPMPFVGLLTHSGSRGPGYKTAQKYGLKAKEYMKEQQIPTDKGYEWLSMDTDLGREYFMAMNLMGDYAQANHDVIHDSFMAIMGLEGWKTYDNHHNFAWRVPGTDKYAHRKGSTPAGRDVAGLIPGTSGSASYIVKGLGNKLALHSAPHGAGLPYSRKEAKSRHDKPIFDQHMASRNIRHAGLAGDETVFAYKNIDAVMKASNELVEIVGKMYPRIVLMGGK